MSKKFLDKDGTALQPVPLSEAEKRERQNWLDDQHKSDTETVQCSICGESSTIPVDFKISPAVMVVSYCPICSIGRPRTQTPHRVISIGDTVIQARRQIERVISPTSP